MVLLVNLRSDPCRLQLKEVCVTRILPAFNHYIYCHSLSLKQAETCVLITVTTSWARWRLISPASRLFTQPFIQEQIKENIKAPRYWPLRGIHRWPVNFPHKWSVTRKMFPFDDVIMTLRNTFHSAKYCCIYTLRPEQIYCNFLVF